MTDDKDIVFSMSQNEVVFLEPPCFDDGRNYTFCEMREVNWRVERKR